MFTGCQYISSPLFGTPPPLEDYLNTEGKWVHPHLCSMCGPSYGDFLDSTRLIRHLRLNTSSDRSIRSFISSQCHVFRLDALLTWRASNEPSRPAARFGDDLQSMERLWYANESVAWPGLATLRTTPLQMSKTEREPPRKPPRYCCVATDISVERIRLIVNYQSRAAKNMSMAITRCHQSVQSSCPPALATHLVAPPI